MDITQTFYDRLASEYDKLFLDWSAATREQAHILDRIFRNHGFDHTAAILDCACGIGTQSIGLGAMGYQITASDISNGALAEGRKRAAESGVPIRFAQADFCALADTFEEVFNIIICMDNALPHMLSASALETAVKSIANQLAVGGLFVASIRDYDTLLTQKPPYSPPYIHKTPMGQKVSFQTWDWDGDHYKLVQYIIDDECTLKVSRFQCEYRATLRAELSNLLQASGFCHVMWLFPDETGFYQPIVVAKK